MGAVCIESLNSHTFAAAVVVSIGWNVECKLKGSGLEDDCTFRWQM